MVDQIRSNPSQKYERKSDTLAAGLDRAPEIRSSSRSHLDDIIGSLANEYENKRARQVSEWERLLKQNISDSPYRAVL